MKIEFKLLNWKFMNFSQRFREDTHLFSIKKVSISPPLAFSTSSPHVQLLRERHGRMDDLKLCFHAFTEANEVHDEMLTLQECGLKGVPVGYAQTDEEKELEDKSVPVVQLFYDFKPTNYSDPVVLYFR